MFYSLKWRNLCCALHEDLVTPVRKLLGRIAVLSKDLFSISGENQTHEHWSEYSYQSTYRNSLFVIFVCYHTLVLDSNIYYAFISQIVHGKLKKYVQKHISFEESKCTSTDEIDQDTPASSAPQCTESDFWKKGIISCLQQDCIRTSFETYLYYGDFSVGLFESPEYSEIALKALQQLVFMTATYMSEKGFSYLVEIMGGGSGGRVVLSPWILELNIFLYIFF